MQIGFFERKKKSSIWKKINNTLTPNSTHPYTCYIVYIVYHYFWDKKNKNDMQINIEVWEEDIHAQNNPSTSNKKKKNRSYFLFSLLQTWDLQLSNK